MKLKKKQAMVLSLVIGSILFATTAFAEINSKNGYDELKDALKYTAGNCADADKFSNFSFNASMTIKDNDRTIFQTNEFAKYDNANVAKETITTSIENGKQNEIYYYTDKNESIYKNSEQDTYYVRKYADQKSSFQFNNPFKEDRASDIEKIADAIIGNLKDSVIVTENADGTKQLSGTISEIQIPAIANAFVSFGVKSRVGNRSYNVATQADQEIPKLVDDIYVKEIKGDMTLSKDGLIESTVGTGVLSGIDEQGKQHQLTMEVIFKITQVNKTIISKPSLAGKKVETTEERDYNKIAKPEMYIGTYSNDIVIQNDGKFQKIGERILEITGLDNQTISGRYHDKYINGYEKYSSDVREFKFTSKYQANSSTEFEAIDASGKKVNGNIYINVYTASISLSISETSYEKVLGYGDFARVFE